MRLANGSKSHRKVRKHRDSQELLAALPYKAKGFIHPCSYFGLGRNTAIGSKPFLFHCEKGLRIFAVDPLCCVPEIRMIIPYIKT